MTTLEVAVFRGCLVVVAAAVADDAFIHPELGVGPADHLASGLVPVACAAGLIAASPRAHAGAPRLWRAAPRPSRRGGERVRLQRLRLGGGARPARRDRLPPPVSRSGSGPDRRAGLSVGGEGLLQAAARTSALRAVVSEGAGRRSLAEHLDDPSVGRVQRWFTGMLAQTAAVAVLSNSAPPDALADLVARIAPRPVLLIEASHGNPDEALNDVYHRAAGPTSELWEVTQGGHTGALAAMPAEYERRVAGFFDRALRPAQP